MSDLVLANASFDKKVKQYWLVYSLLFTSIFVVSIPLIPFVAIIVLIVSQRILDAMSAKLLERKLVVKRGVFFKVEKSIPLEKITDVGMTQGPLMRFFGLHRLDFETAGQSGPGALVSMLGIIEPEKFREQILAQKDKVMMPEKHGTANETESPNDLKELIASVQRIESLLENRLKSGE
jgi:putative membrane protein